MIEGHLGYGVARVRRPHRQPQRSLHYFIKAQLRDVATALAAMTGEPHPLALTIQDHQPTNRQVSPTQDTAYASSIVHRSRETSVADTLCNAWRCSVSFVV